MTAQELEANFSGVVEIGGSSSLPGQYFKEIEVRKFYSGIVSIVISVSTAKVVATYSYS